MPILVEFTLNNKNKPSFHLFTILFQINGQVNTRNAVLKWIKALIKKAFLQGVIVYRTKNCAQSDNIRPPLWA